MHGFVDIMLSKASPGRRLMPNQSIQLGQNVKMYWFNQYNLNIPINSIMLLDTYLHINRLNQVKSMTQMLQSNQSINSIYMLTFLESLFHLPFLGKRSISLIFWGYFESIQFILSYQSLKVNRLSHLLYVNQLTYSPINSLGKGTELIQAILRKKWIASNQSTQSSWMVFKSETHNRQSHHHHPDGVPPVPLIHMMIKSVGC